jgi:glycerol-3-phosphate dehydrogenase (NAD(P)+)
MRISVLGAGSFGTTVASLLSARNDTVLWGRDEKVAERINCEHRNPRYLTDFPLPDRLRATADLEEAVSRASVLILGVPSHGFRETLAQARPFVQPWIPLVSLTKGLEQGSLLRMTQVIEEMFPGHPVAALAGPNIAREIMSGQAAAAVVATDDASVGSELARVLRRGLFRVYRNHDVIGCELGGALKNVIAIACGIAQGIQVGDNTRAMIMTRGLAELSRLGQAMGGEPATFAGLTGLGDLIVTCMSPHSRNRFVGEELGRGKPLGEITAGMRMVAEGIKTAPTVMELARRYDVPMPICSEIDRVVRGEITGGQAYRGLYPPAEHEADPG